MGYAIAWVAFQGVERDLGLARLGLSVTTKTTTYSSNVPYAGHTLPGGFIVVAGRSGHRIISPAVLAALTIDSDAIACSIEEHVMFSSAEGWSRGERKWRLAHDPDKSKRHLEALGDLPAAYATALAEAETQQNEEDAGPKEVDFFFEVPLQVAKSLVGFKHDEDSPGVDGDKFVVLNAEAGASGRRWWEIWK